MLDSCFYLAGLPRPDIGMSDERIAQVNALLGRELSSEEVEAFRQILHGYKKGKVEGDDLVAEISKALGAHDALISTVLEKVFPEFRELKAEATTRTLRSHMTSGWFLSLSNLHYRQQAAPQALLSGPLLPAGAGRGCSPADELLLGQLRDHG